jgi:hypothetical protein
MRVWRHGDTVRVPVSAVPPEDGETVLAVSLAEWDGAPGETLLAKPASGVPTVFTLARRDPGWYRLRAALLKDGREIAAAETAIAVLPPAGKLPQGPAETSPFGVCTHFGRPTYDRPETFRLLRLSGIRWIRDDLSWDSVEREAPGRYAVPQRLERIARELRGDDIRTLLILGYASRFHAHGTEDEPPAFERYAAFAAQALAGAVDHFEIWNEPNGFGKLTPERYPAILKAGYRGVKRGNPQAFVVGLGGSSPGGWCGHYIHRGIYPQEAVGFMDSFSIHPYTSPWAPETGYRSMGAPAPIAGLGSVDKLTFGLAGRIAQAKGLAAPPGVWITEMGWPLTETTPAGQAQGVARAYLYAAAHPALYARCFIYDFVCDGADARDKESTFGLLGHDLAPRPAYVAASVVARVLDQRVFARRIEHADDRVHLYLFGPAEDPLLAGWITEVGPARKVREPELGKAGSALQDTLEVELPADGGAASVTDWQGRERSLPVRGGRLRLTLGTWPQYVRGVTYRP